MRIYISSLIGSGSDADPIRPLIADLQTSDWTMVDNGDLSLVMSDNTDEEHAVLIGDSRITHCPTNDADVISEISDENIANLSDIITNVLGLSLDGIEPEMPVDQVLSLLVSRLL